MKSFGSLAAQQLFRQKEFWFPLCWFGVSGSLVDVESEAMEKIVGYAYSGKIDFSTSAKNFVRKSLLPGE